MTAIILAVAGFPVGTIIMMMIARDRAVVIVMVMLGHIHRSGEVRERMSIPCSRRRSQKARQKDAKQRAPKAEDHVHAPLLLCRLGRSNRNRTPH